MAANMSAITHSTTLIRETLMPLRKAACALHPIT
jgi:hypothetical protein